jgi:hypothetical protein
VEADVWLVNGTLYIGHEVQALTPNRTFDGLYIEPLVNILTNSNPKTAFTQQLTLSPMYILRLTRLIVEAYLIETAARLCTFLSTSRQMDLQLGRM